MEKNNLNQENYYTDTDYMSVSRYKQMLECHNQTQFDTHKSTAMLVGSYVDSYIEGTLDKFKEENPEIFSSRGATKGQLKSEFKIAEDVCKYLDDDELAQKFLSGEKQTIMTGEINNVPFKIKMDSYIPDKCIVDLKVMRTIRNSKGELYNFIEQFGYSVQLACYQEIVFQNTGKRLPCYILVATKETPIECRVIQIPQEILDEKLNDVYSNIEVIWKVFKGELPKLHYCGKCPICIKNNNYKKLINMYELNGGIEYELEKF